MQSPPQDNIPGNLLKKFTLLSRPQKIALQTSIDVRVEYRQRHPRAMSRIPLSLESSPAKHARSSIPWIGVSCTCHSHPATKTNSGTFSDAEPEATLQCAPRPYVNRVYNSLLIFERVWTSPLMSDESAIQPTIEFIRRGHECQDWNSHTWSAIP